jgi:hypothetical protein
MKTHHRGLHLECKITVPGQILIVFVAELTLYGFWGVDGQFAELLRILEKDGATELVARQTRQARGGSMGSGERIGAALAWGSYFRGGEAGVVLWACWAWYWLSQRSRRETAEWKS